MREENGKKTSGGLERREDERKMGVGHVCIIHHAICGQQLCFNSIQSERCIISKASERRWRVSSFFISCLLWDLAGLI
jgi:hypothetical protein